MERPEVTKQVLALIEQKGYFGDIPSEETTLDDLGWDSMDFAEIQVMIEKEFLIYPKEAEWERHRTVGEWVDLVMKHIKEN